MPLTLGFERRARFACGRAVPVLGFAAAYLFSASFRAFGRRISLSLLVGLHLWRFVGVGFVIAWLIGRLRAPITSLLVSG